MDAFRRHLLGLLALALIGVGLYCLAQYGSSSVVAGLCLRAGAMLGAIWLALPQILGQLRRSRPAVFVPILLAIAGTIIFPKRAIYFVPFLILLAVLQICGRWLQSQPRAK